MNLSIHHLLAFAALTALSTSLTAQRLLRESFGPEPGATYGAALAASPDGNGDGVRELLIGAPGLDWGILPDVGGAYLVAPNTGALLLQVSSPFANARYGTRVAAPGDLDGDGQIDVVLTAPLWLSGVGTGAVQAWSRQGSLLWTVLGEPNSQLGAAIAPIASVDGNALPDLLIGAPKNTNSTPFGMAAAWSGQSATRLSMVAGSHDSDMGAALVSLGDLDGNGFTEVACGEPSFAGFGMGNILVLRSDRSGGQAVLWQRPFLTQGNHLGTSLGVAGDLDGDGRDDLLAPSRTGRLYALSGTSGATVWEITIAELDETCAVTGIGDQNGDGVPEVAVGLPQAGQNAGRVDVFDGASRQRLYWLAGSAGSRFGAALAALGDVDGDGRGDFAVGAPTHLVQGQAIGRVAVFGQVVGSELSSYGLGCAGVHGTLDLLGVGIPRPGQTVGVRLYQLAPQSIGFWLQGFSDTSSSLGPLPLDLGPLTGAVGCHLLQSAEFVGSFFTGNQLYLNRTTNLPNTNSFVGLRWHTQALQLEPTRPGGFTVSNGVTIRIGNQ
jgi:hypothetical protein